jgi:hypothetical protein
VTFRKIRDGTSNTVVLVEVKPELAVPWTAPRNYAFDVDDPAAGLRVGADGRWVAATADSAVHEFRGDAPPEMILRLFRMNDGNVIDFSTLR